MPTLPIRVALLACLSLPAAAQLRSPQPLLPEAQVWFSPPGNPAARATWMLGSESASGPYLLRVVLAAGARLPPHTHPDTRSSTVLAGTLLVGFGERFDAEVMVAVPAGGVYVAPAGVPHFLWARDGEVIYQEAGAGPTATVPWPARRP